jgi:hypothetical protein
MERIVQVGDKACIVTGPVRTIPPGPDQDTRPRARKRQRIPRDGRVRVTRTGPQVPIPEGEEPALRALAVLGSRYAIDTIFRAYVGIINVVIHQYNDRATDDDVQDAYEVAIRTIRSPAIPNLTLNLEITQGIRHLFSHRREMDRGPDAMDRAVSIESASDGRDLTLTE